MADQEFSSKRKTHSDLFPDAVADLSSSDFPCPLIGRPPGYVEEPEHNLVEIVAKRSLGEAIVLREEDAITEWRRVEIKKP